MPRMPRGAVAKGQKTGGRNFPRGVSGNPNGRPPVPDDVREAREADRVELARILHRVLRLTKKELAARFKDDATPALERMIVQLVRSACWGGNPYRVGFLLKQIGGPSAPDAGGGSDENTAVTFVELMQKAAKAAADGEK
jgi:hypothetical protein